MQEFAVILVRGLGIGAVFALIAIQSECGAPGERHLQFRAGCDDGARRDHRGALHAECP